MMVQPSARRQPTAQPRQQTPMNPPRRPRAPWVLRVGIAVLTGAVAISALPATAVVDSTDDYPISHLLGGLPGKIERSHPSTARTSGTPSIIMSPRTRPRSQIRLGAGTRNVDTQLFTGGRK
jgi:hypothetical protein